MRIGIIGGTGIGERLLEDLDATHVEPLAISTPFGAPSDTITLATIADDLQLALLPRHGPGHSIPPHRLPNRANIFALKSLGVSHVIASGACGSLREDIHPGQLALPDQTIDRTDGRERTFFDDFAAHVEFSEPFCPVLRAWLGEASPAARVTLHDSATFVIINGPTFSSRAEAEFHRHIGADLVGMTALPEARLAREAQLAYATIAIPTDYDCWRPHAPGESAESLLAHIRANLQAGADAAFRLIRAALQDVGPLRESPSPAHNALANGVWTDPAQIPPDVRARLAPLFE
jgi:5'-methylthioadenosine phosphorylase